MEYCRSLKFEEDPDYKYCVSLFEKCMKNHSLDSKTLDYTWKQNRLSKDKEALKNSMMDVIRKKPKVVPAQGRDGIAGGGLNSGMNHGESGGMQAYGASGQGAHNATMMGMQQAPAAHQYQNPSNAYGGTNA